MKFENVASDLQVIGDIEENKIGIDTANLDFIVTILSSNLYSNPIGSFLRETVSNAFDSHVEAGTDDPVILILNKDLDGQYFCEIQDFGVGLSPERFNKIYKNIGSSTKRDSNNQIGGFGIGRFAALSYADIVNITSTYEGVVTQYLMYKDGNSINISVLSSLPTKDNNGVRIRIPVNSNDVSRFYDNIFSQLSYFNNLYVNFYDKKKETLFNNQKIINREFYKTLKYKTEPVITDNSVVKILLGKVTYPFNNSEIGFNYQNFYDYYENLPQYVNPTDETKKELNSIKRIYTCLSVLQLPIVLKFEIGELGVVPNREQILYNSKSKELIKQRLNEALYEFILNISNKSIEFSAKTIEEYVAFSNSTIAYNIVDDEVFPTSIGTKSETFNYKEYEGTEDESSSSITLNLNVTESISALSSLIKVEYKGDYSLNSTLFTHLSSRAGFAGIVNKKQFLTYYIGESTIKSTKDNLFSINDSFGTLENKLIGGTKRNEIIFMHKDMYDNLSALEKRFLRFEYTDKTIYTYTDIESFIQSFSTKSSLLSFYRTYLRGRYSYEANSNFKMPKNRFHNFKEFTKHLRLYFNKLESNFRLVLKKTELKKIDFTSEFLLFEEEEKEQRRLNKESIDYNEVFNLEVVGKYGNVNRKYQYESHVDNYTVSNIERISKEQLVIYSTKDDDNIIDFINIFSSDKYYRKTQSRLPILVLRIAKTKISRLDNLSQKNKNLINFNTMINNPQDFRYIRDLGTAYRIYKEHKYIFDIYSSSVIMNILSKLNNKLYEEIKTIGLLLSKFKITDQDSFKNKAIAKQTYEICKINNIFNVSVLGSVDIVEKDREGLEYILNLGNGLQSISYNVNLTGNNPNEFLQIIAKLLLKSKILRPDFEILSYQKTN